MTRVWFNHWFSTAYHIINLMKKDVPDIHIIGSNRNPDCVYKLVCGEFFTEPDSIPDEDYVNWCLDFCVKNSVDVFVVRRGLAAVSRSRELFEEKGIKLLAESNAETVDILRDKIRTYEYLSDVIPECIPEYFRVQSVDEFREAYSRITSKYDRAIFKFSADEGATSFRVIDNSLESSKALYTAPGMKISFNAALGILSQYSFKNPLIVMPYLREREVSCDCLCTEKGNIIIPRYKSDSRIYTVTPDSEVISICEKILAKIRPQMPCNIQLKYDDGKPYLLEINTRMSGGVQLSVLGSGINIPAVALGKLLNRDIPFETSFTEKRVSYIEDPVML